MGNQLLTPPELDPQATRPYDDHTQLLPVGTEQPIWSSLVENFRDVFAPKKLPPLKLTSTPVPVGDLLAEKRSPLSSGISIGLHVLIIALIIWGLIDIRSRTIVKKTTLTPVDVSAFIPVAPKKAITMGGGGGGGNHEILPPTKGKLPKMAKVQITPPADSAGRQAQARRRADDRDAAADQDARR